MKTPLPIPDSEFPKTCRCCGRVFRRREEWDALEYVGIQRAFGDSVLLSLANCFCGSTISVCVRGRDLLDEMSFTSSPVLRFA